MNREQFEKEYLHKKVKITLFDDTRIIGKLYRTDDELFKYNPTLYLKKNYYVTVGGWTDNLTFRKSHIKHISEVDE